jgi:ABC-type uncharacterized transport system involved in gliding motility auxiliary subunit
MPQDTRQESMMKPTSKFTGLGGAILVLAAIFVATYYPAEKAALWVLGVVGGACLLFFFISERHVLARAQGSRATRYGANAGAMAFAFLGILVVLNILSIRHNGKWDVTEGRTFTRSDQTLQVLKGLSKDVAVTAFFADGAENRQRMKDLLDDYADKSLHLKVTFVDPDKNPALAKQHNIRAYGTTLFQSGDQTYRITEISEEAVTNALVRVTRQAKKTICFLAGHGERSPEDSQRGGYSTAKKALEEQGYAAKDVLLLREGEVPKECDVLVAAGPTKPVLKQELTALKGYLDKGGKMVLLIDPQAQTGLEPLLQDWGVVLHNDMVIDTMSRLFGGSYTTPILTEYPDHEITKNFRLATFLPLARSIDKANPLPDGVSFKPVARTSPQSWGETDLSNSQASLDPAVDYKGPLVVAGLFEKNAKDPSGKSGAQLLVVGDSDFADNTYFNFSGNGDLFQNMISYLAKEKDLISIRPKDAKPSPLILTQAQAATLFYASVVAAPLGLVLAGLGIWWRRKNL